jgi:hypothetical protein
VIISNIFVTNPANKRTQIDLLEKNGIWRAFKYHEKQKELFTWELYASDNL